MVDHVSFLFLQRKHFITHRSAEWPLEVCETATVSPYEDLRSDVGKHIVILLYIFFVWEQHVMGLVDA